MQYTGYLKINNENIFVLVRTKKYTRQLKLRKSGKPGMFLEDESIMIEKHNLVVLEKLKKGEVIEV
jgi:hypothetical protein